MKEEEKQTGKNGSSRFLCSKNSGQPKMMIKKMIKHYNQRKRELPSNPVKHEHHFRKNAI
jgi:hypothetical protein